MVKMGTIWDRTVEVLNGRTGLIVPIAILGMVLPGIVRDGYVAFSTPGSAQFALIGGLLTLVALAAMIWAQLSIVAIATDPATDGPRARAQGAGRLLPAIGITVLLTVVAGALALPPIFVLAGAGFDFATAANRGTVRAPVAGGAALFTLVYFAVYFVVAIWIGARLILLNPVILNERLGVAAIRRSFALTRGMGWRIIGVMILFVIALVVAAGAVQSVTGIVFRLVLGPNGIGMATFLAGVFVKIVTAAFTALAAIFTARLYVAVSESSDA